MKNGIYKGIFAVAVIGYFFFLGQELKHYLDPAPPAAVIHEPVIALAGSTLKAAETPPPPRSLDDFLVSRDFKKITLRFQQKYPSSTEQQGHKELSEAAYRLTVLQGLQKDSHTMSLKNRALLLRFYTLVLKNNSEFWLVKRQALKNIAPLWTHFKQQEKEQILAQVDVRARMLWDIPDTVLIQKMVGDDAP